MTDDVGYRERMGALLRSTANDLKRNSAAAAKDLGLSEAEYQDLVNGRRELSAPALAAVSRSWPVNERDILPIHNDCPDGVLRFAAEDSAASARVLSRGGADYYEYRDTAMSRLASFRPEWIRMLAVVDDDKPDNPAVQWNNGHLLYQFTYFVGPVNYYYRWGGRSHVLRMRTGDSIWGLPFSPHTFTARRAGEPAYILALTYGGELTGDARHELSALGLATARKFAMTGTDEAATVRGRLRSFLDAAMMSAGELARLTGWPVRRLAELVEGTATASAEELAVLADALRVSVRDLLPIGIDSPCDICVVRGADARRWPYPAPERHDYTVTELAGNRLHPHTRALEIRPRREHGDVGAFLTTYQHQYLYNVGADPLAMRWEHAGREHRTVLHPGDSAYVMPFVPCAYGVERTADHPCLLALRINGSVTGEVRTALGAMHPGGLERMLHEDRAWYREE
ncbi:helix-turn-helix domain-containing protein [Actinophytocola sp. KF-1]